MKSLRARLAKAAGWTEKSSDKLLKMNLPRQEKGYGRVVVAKNRRNTKKRRARGQEGLVSYLHTRIRRGLMQRGSVPEIVDVMEWGVQINGRAWAKGSFCQYAKDTRDGSRTLLLGNVVKFYAFAGNGNVPLFVLIRHHTAREQRGVMVVVDADAHGQHVVHIDCLAFLLHLAPHYNTDVQHLKCALPVASAYPTVLVEDLNVQEYT